MLKFHFVAMDVCLSAARGNTFIWPGDGRVTDGAVLRCTAPSAPHTAVLRTTTHPQISENHMLQLNI